MAKKKRVKIPDEVASEVLFRNERTCCLCREPGKAVQIHHIDEDPSNNSLENLAVVCIECQNAIHRKGGIEKGYLPSEVRKNKSLWEKAVADKRKYLGTPPIIRKTKEFDPRTGIERVIEERIPYANGLAAQAINIKPPVSLGGDKQLIIEELRRVVPSELGSDRLLSILDRAKRTAEIKMDDMVVLSRICLSIGDSKFGIGDYSLAEIFYKEALRYARSTREREIITVCLYEVGASVGMQGRHKEALGYFEDVIKRDMNNAAAWFNKGVSLSSMSNNKGAILAYRKAVEFGEKAESWGTVASGYYGMGSVQDRLERYDDAIDCYRKAVGFGEKAQEWATVASAYGNMGTVENELERWEEALVSQRKAIEFGERAQKWVTVANAYGSMGNTQDALERYDDAIDCYRKAVEFAEKAGEWEVVAGAYYNMGGAHHELERYDDAINCYRKTVEFGEKAGKCEVVADAYYNMGVSQQHNLQRYEDAIDSYRKAVEFGERAQDWGVVAHAYFNMGSAQHSLERDEDGINSWRKAIEFGRKGKDWETVGDAYYNIGYTRHSLERDEDGINSWRKAIGFSEKAQHWETVAIAYYNIGSTRQRLERYEDAIDSYRKAVEFGQKAQDWKTVGSAYYNMGVCQYKVERWEDGIDSCRKAIEWRSFLPDRGERVFRAVAQAVCVVGTKHIQDKKYGQAKRFARVLGRLYLDGEKDGMAGIIGKTMEEFGSKLSEEEGTDEFREFKELFDKVKNKGRKEGK